MIAILLSFQKTFFVYNTYLASVYKMTDFSTEHTRPTVLYFKKKQSQVLYLKTTKSEKWIRVT